MPARQLIWFRNDLRIHDQEVLTQALRNGDEIIPLYCFDPRQFGKTSFGFPKTSGYRAQFLCESVADLRQSLQRLGSDLIIRQGKPEDIIPELIQQLNITSLGFSEAVTPDEIAVETAVNAAVRSLKTEIKSVWGATLYHRDNLPCKLSKVPDLFTHFRKIVEADCKVYENFPTPPGLSHLPPDLERGALPTLNDLGVEPLQIDSRAVLQFKGGETAGQQRLQDYFWDGDYLKNYQKTRNGMLGADYSTKFSPWLALGCLSPRDIYWQVQDYKVERIKNDSTYWITFSLLWRDYFHFMAAKHGSKLFQGSGLRGVALPWQQHPEQFEHWCQGETGFPLIDANMRELRLTGFISNRGRQNVASFLTKNLGIDWRMGAEWFESLLIDYDPCSNWGNWNLSAGLGPDAQTFRFLNLQKQGKEFDPEGLYIKHWLRELQDVPTHKIHEPWKMLQAEQRQCGVTLGQDYPVPMVDMFKSAKANEQAYNAAMPAPTTTEKNEKAKPRDKRDWRGHKGRSHPPSKPSPPRLRD
jgi:deoxyribodipyrimidine photo-lyase